VITVKLDTTGLKNLENRFRRLTGRVPKGSAMAVNRLGDRMLAMVRQNASGRPGPEVRTGAYLGTITIVERSSAGNVSSVYVGSGAPESARLELGYIGTDAAGRHVEAPPYPHFRPAAVEMEQIAKKEVYDGVVGEIRAS
jgi:hypothetical protein